MWETPVKEIRETQIPVPNYAEYFDLIECSETPYLEIDELGGISEILINTNLGMFKEDNVYKRRHALTIRAICAKQGKHKSSVSGIYDINASLAKITQDLIEGSLGQCFESLKEILTRYKNAFPTEHLLGDVIDERIKVIDGSFQDFWDAIKKEMQTYLTTALHTDIWQEAYDADDFSKPITKERLRFLTEVLTNESSQMNQYFDSITREVYQKIVVEPLISFFSE